MFGLGNFNMESLMKIDLGKTINDLLVAGVVFLSKKHELPFDDIDITLKVKEIESEDGKKENKLYIFVFNANTRERLEVMTAKQLEKAIRG